MVYKNAEIVSQDGDDGIIWLVNFHGGEQVECQTMAEAKKVVDQKIEKEGIEIDPGLPYAK